LKTSNPYWRLLAYVKPYALFFALSIVGNLFFAFSQPAFAALMQYFVEALQGGPENLVYQVPLAGVAIALVRGIGSFVGTYFISFVGQGVVHDLRCALFNHMLLLPNTYYDRQNSGHLVSRITFNVNNVTNAATKAVTVLFREGMTVIALFAFLLYTNWKLTLIFLCIGPLIGLLVNWVGRRMRRLSTRIQNAMGDIARVTSETVSGHRVVRIHGAEKRESQRFLRASRENLRQALKFELTNALNSPVMQFLVIAAMSVVMYAVLSMRTEYEPGVLIAYLTGAALLPKSLRSLSEVHGQIQKGVAAAESIFEMLDTPGEIDEGELVTDRARGELDIRDLRFTYPAASDPALNGVSLHVDPGSMVALVGRSGSGKSTLVNLLPRFYSGFEGDILLDGEPLQSYKLENLRQQLAMVSQDVVLFNDTVHNNIAYGASADATAEEVVAAARSAYADEFIQSMSDGYDTLIGENGVLLSGGQRQRIAIARAILRNAPILILDEATAALDTESERYIQQAMEEVMRDRTTLVIAHRLSTIEKADVIVVMDGGKIVESGTHRELLQKGGAYAALQAKGFADEAPSNS
jgi:subfamily B ATP-binding cassette protein MsbA